jgi:hypothetical protein
MSAGTDLVRTDLDAEVPVPAITKAFVSAFQALGREARQAASDLYEYERVTDARATPLSRRRCQELQERRDALLEALVAAERAMQDEFDKFSVRQAVAVR